VYMIDWDKTLAYASTPSSNGVHIVVGDGSSEKGVPKTRYQAFRSELIERLYGLTSPGTGEPVVSRVWTREEAFDGPFMDHAPDLTLTLRDGGLISILPSKSSVKQREEVSGTHRMEGTFMAKGPGILQGTRLYALSILDVAPILVHSLGLPIPEEMEGRVPAEIFEPLYVQQHPVEVSGHADAATLVAKGDGDPLVFDAEAEAKMAEHLRALGYIE
jgi:predicted AlkP superfamily phosphohydrolase/phosphomutase